MSNYDPTLVMGPDERRESNPQRDQQPAGGNYRPTMRMSGERSYGPTNANATVSLRPSEPPTFAWLVVIEGIHAGHLFKINGDSTVIGRDTACDVVLDDATASRQHAKIRVEGEKEDKHFVIFDLATENGTSVNGEEVMKHVLEDDDRIIIGETNLAFKQVKV